MAIITFLSIIATFLLACGISLFKIIPHNYFQYSCFKLIAIIFQGYLNKWIFSVLSSAFVVSMIYLLVLLIKKLIKDLPLLKSPTAGFKNRKRRKILSLCIFICATIILLGTANLIMWSIQHLQQISESLHPLNFIIGTGIVLSITFFLIGLFLLNKNFNLFKKLRKKRYIRNLCISLIISVIIFNLYIFIDKKTNAPKGPNIILIEVDTLRADHLSCYGYKRKTTPHIDNFSQKANFYQNCITTSPWTTPSVGSIFTSQYPSVLGYKGERAQLKNKFLTLSEILKNNNYFTKGIISNIFISSSLNFNQGFNSYDETSVKGGDSITSPSITQKGISFIKKHKKDKFFLFLFYYDPHHDFILHKNFNYYPNYNGKIESNESILKLRKLIPKLTPKDKKYSKALYDSEISYTDKYIGKFLTELKKLSLYHDSLIIFTGDHGEEFAERKNPWLGHSRKLYQEQIRVPLIIKLPGQKNKRIIKQKVGQIGLMSTILQQVGLKIPKNYLHENKTIPLNHTSSRKYIISETKRDNKLRSVIWGDWKLIYNLSNKTRELYNLRKDPGELHNLTKKNKTISQKLEDFLKVWNKNIKLKKGHFNTDKKVKSADFSKEQIERLKSLGYIE